jgi:predicted phage tail protein
LAAGFATGFLAAGFGAAFLTTAFLAAGLAAGFLVAAGLPVALAVGLVAGLLAPKTIATFARGGACDNNVQQAVLVTFASTASGWSRWVLYELRAGVRWRTVAKPEKADGAVARRASMA